jgi:HK97 family phage major capsid protein
MSVDLEKLHAARRNAANEIQTLLDEVDARSDKEMSAEDQAKFDRLNAEYDRRSRQIEIALDDLEVSKRFNEVFSKKIEPEEAAPADAELRKFLKGESRSFDVRVEQRDLSKLSAGAGADTVPVGMSAQLWAHMVEVSGVLRANPTIIRTNSGEAIEFPTTTSHGSAALATEGSGIAENDPVFAKRSIPVYKYGQIVQVSRELIDDTAVDLTGYLAMAVGRNLGNASGTHFVTGTGSSQPAGVATRASVGVTGAASVAGAFTADNLIDLFYSVISPYRNSASCAWLMRDATVANVRKLKDTTNQYLWQPAMSVGAPETLLGKPLLTDPNVAAVALSARSVLFGDMSAYYVRLVQDIRFERSDDFAFNADLVTFRAVLRAGGELVDQTGAVKAFVGNAA